MRLHRSQHGASLHNSRFRAVPDTSICRAKLVLHCATNTGYLPTHSTRKGLSLCRARGMRDKWPHTRRADLACCAATHPDTGREHTR